MRHVAIALLLLFAPTLVVAQYDIVPSDVSLDMMPQMPYPGDLVTLTVRGADNREGGVMWYVDGKKTASNTTTTSLIAGRLGSEITVDAVVIVGEVSETLTAYVRPAQLELVWSADSYTPPFFKGRALPGIGSTIAFEAVPHFQKGDTAISLKDIVFTWTRNGAVSSQSGPGRSHALFPGPALFGTDVITVEARTIDGLRAARASVRLPSTDTHLVLYHDHPLFGVLFNNPFTQPRNLSEKEVAIIAVPFYAHMAARQHPTYLWHINAQEATPNPDTPDRLVLRSDAPSVADITVSLSDQSNPFEAARGSWRIGLQTTQR